MVNKIPMMPASFFGIVLGLVGLGDCWRAAHVAWGTPTVVSTTIMVIATAVWFMIMALWITKWIVAPSVSRAEASHPVQSCFVELSAVSTLLIAYLADSLWRPLAIVLFGIGATTQLIWGCHFTATRLRGGFDRLTITPALYLPTVAGNFVSAFVAGYLGFRVLGLLFLGAGALSWLMLESQIGFRMSFDRHVDAPLRPTVGILLAPPVVGCEAYLFIAPGRPNDLAIALVGYGIFVFFVLARSLPGVVAEQPFAPSYWAYSFGVTSLAFDLVLMHARGMGGFFGWLSMAAFIIANVAIVVLCGGTLMLLARGRLFPHPSGSSSPSPSTA